MLRKIKIMNRENTQPKTPKQRRNASISATLLFLENNPMKNLEVRKKVSDKLKGRITSPNNLFKKGNKYGVLNRGKKRTEEEKIKMSVKMIGNKRNTLFQRERARVLFLENNPMKNPKIAKKNADVRRGKLQKINKNVMAIRKWRNDNGKDIRDLYLNKKLSTTEIGKVYGVSKWMVWKCLKSLDVKMRKGGIPRYTCNRVEVLN